MCNQATSWGAFWEGCIHCQTFTLIRDRLHFPDAPCNSEQLLRASTLTHLAEKMKSGGVAARAGASLHQAFLQLKHPPHAGLIPTCCKWPEPWSCSCQAKGQSMGMPFSLAKGKSGKRKKHLREGWGKQTAGRHAGGTACLSLPNSPGSSTNLFGT